MERFSDGTTGRDGRGPAFPKETDGIPHGAKHLPYNKIRKNGTRSGGEGADLPSGTNGTNGSWISGSEGSGGQGKRGRPGLRTAESYG